MSATQCRASSRPRSSGTPGCAAMPTGVQCTRPSVSAISCGSAGTELDHAVQLRAGQAGGEGGAEAGKVGVVADEAAVLDHHGVDGAKLQGVRGDDIQVLQDQLLAGVGDVQSVEAEGAGVLEQLADGFARQAQFQEVDGAVKVAQALHITFAFV